MILSIFMALAAPFDPAGPDAWTWSLYADGDPVVLAEEVPDTPRLRTTLECARGSGVVEISLHDPARPAAEGDSGAPGFVTVSAGGAAATSELATWRQRQSFTLRTDHPVFARFLGEGRLSIQGLGRERRIDAGAEGMPELRQFVTLCG